MRGLNMNRIWPRCDFRAGHSHNRGQDSAMVINQQIRRILFATDLLASSSVVLDYAIAFAQHFKAIIVMVHAVELPYRERGGDRELPARLLPETRIPNAKVGRWNLPWATVYLIY
jgi:hypothetical protein